MSGRHHLDDDATNFDLHQTRAMFHFNIVVELALQPSLFLFDRAGQA